MHLAAMEIAQIVDPMCRLAVFARQASLHWQERYRTDQDVLYWDTFEMADNWPTPLKN